MKSREERIRRKADKFLPFIKGKIEETDDIVPIDLTAVMVSEEKIYKSAKCSTCSKEFRLMSSGSIILHCNTAETKHVRELTGDADAFVMFAFCNKDCVRFLKMDVYCHRCNSLITKTGAEKYDHLYDLFFLNMGSHVLKITCCAACKTAIQKEDSKSQELGVKIICATCGKYKDTMPRCPCGNINFCDKECQLRAWPTHKLTCVWYLNKSK